MWHDYPLPFHQDAMPAAEAAREVRAQRGDAAFWAFHDMVFEHQREGAGVPVDLGQVDLREPEADRAGQVGVDRHLPLVEAVAVGQGAGGR